LPTQRPSQNSAGVTFLNKEARISDLRRAAARARERMPALGRIILFGSLVSGAPTPRSDADLMAVVIRGPHEHARDRVPELLAALSPLPCPVDVFVVTENEFERAQHDGTPLIREALAHGVDLL
jgi:predicted nucleotidyltransferase